MRGVHASWRVLSLLASLGLDSDGNSTEAAQIAMLEKEDEGAGQCSKLVV
jgi:hypothetical protein